MKKYYLLSVCLLYPLTLLAYFLGNILLPDTGLQLPDPATQALQLYFVVGVVVLLVDLWCSKHVTSDDKLWWTLVLFVFGFLPAPVYWFMEIRSPRETLSGTALMKSMRAKRRAFTVVLSVFVIALTAAACGTVHINNVNKKNGTPQAGDRYEVTGPVYFYGVYRNLNKREINSEQAFGSFTAVRVSGPEIAFEEVVPIGTTVTIIGPAPNISNMPFMANRYFVELDPDPSRGLEVILGLNRGMEGSLDGLNPELFRKLP